MNFKIQHHYGVISSSERYHTDVNLVAWGNREAKIDIRKWNADEMPMKGICITMDEAKKLHEILGTLI